MALSVFNMTRSIVNSILGRNEAAEEGSDDDFLTQTRQDQSEDGSMSSESEVSYTESEKLLESVPQAQKKLERLRRLLELLPARDEEEAESLREDIQMAELRLKKAKRREAKRLLREKRLEQERQKERQQPNQPVVTRDSETPVITVEEHQRQMRNLDKSLRGTKPRKPGPPKVGEILDPDQVKDLEKKGYTFSTVRVKETAGIFWEKVTSVEGVDMSNSEESLLNLTIPTHGEQIDGKILVKLINAKLVPLIGERVNEGGVVTVGNYEETFSTRDQTTGQLQALNTISGLTEDYVAAMLANGRYRIATMRVLQELLEHGGQNIENIRIASNSVSDEELMSITPSSHSKDQTEETARKDGSSEQVDKPTVPQPRGTLSHISDTELQEKGLPSSGDATEASNLKSKASDPTYEPPKCKLGTSGSIENIENKAQLQRVGKELKSCKAKVTRLRNKLSSADLESLPLEEIERGREEFEVRLQELIRVWHEKVSYMESESGFKEAETAKYTLQGYQIWLSDLKKLEMMKRNFILETPKISRAQHHVTSSDESEVNDQFEHANWSQQMKNVEHLSRTSKTSQKSGKRKNVEFRTDLRTDFEEGVRGTSTPAPTHVDQGISQDQRSDPLLLQIEQMRQAFEREKEELKKETARGLDQMRKSFEAEREKFRQELARTTSSPLISPQRSTHPQNISRDSDSRMSTVMEVIDRQSQGRSLRQAVSDALGGSSVPHHTNSPRQHETREQRSSHHTFNRSSESSRREGHHDSRERNPRESSSFRSRRYDHEANDTGQQTSRSDPGRPYDKIPTKLNIKKFSGNQDEFLLFKAKFQTLVESKHLPPEEKAVILVDNLEKDPLKLATAVVAGKFRENSLQRIWESLEEHYGGERRRKTMPLQRLRSMNFITKFNRQELLNFHVILTEIRSHYASTDEDRLWEENSEIVSLARERISEARQSEYLSHLRYLNRKDNFISLCNWIKDKLEIHHNVEETSVMRKAGERSYGTIEELDEFNGDESIVEEHPEGITAAGHDNRRRPYPSDKKQSQDNLHQSTLESLANKSSSPPVQQKRERPVCLFCKKEHPLYSCDAFDKIALEDRNKFVRTNRVCFHCLNPGHVATKCDYFPSRVCNLDGCQGIHHRKLHPPKTSSCFGYEEEYPDEILGSELEQVTAHTHSQPKNGTYVAIRTVPAILRAGSIKRRLIVALDACANNTNISESLAEELGLRKLKDNVSRSIKYLERTGIVKSDMVQFNLCPLDESHSPWNRLCPSHGSHVFPNRKSRRTHRRVDRSRTCLFWKTQELYIKEGRRSQLWL